MPSKKKRNGKLVGWLAQVRRQGVVKSKVCTTKEKALEQEAEWKQELNQTFTETVMVLDWADRYLDFCQERFAEVTYEGKREAFDWLTTEVGDVPVESLSAGQMLNVLSNIRRQRTGYTANKVRKDLVAGWNWGRKFIEQWPNIPNPVAQVAKFGYTKQQVYVPPMEDVQAVLDKMPPEDRVMLLCYLHTGARRDEVFRLQWSDINFPAKRISLWTRKRQDGSWESNTVRMTEELRQALLQHRGTTDGQGLVFHNQGRKYKHRRHWLGYWCGIAQVPRFTIKSIRHLTASWLCEQGVPVSTIQSVLRHKKATTTDNYLRELLGAKVDLDSVFGMKEAKVLDIKKASK